MSTPKTPKAAKSSKMKNPGGADPFAEMFALATAPIVQKATKLRYFLEVAYENSSGEFSAFIEKKVGRPAADTDSAPGVTIKTFDFATEKGARNAYFRLRGLRTLHYRTVTAVKANDVTGEATKILPVKRAPRNIR